MKDRRLLLSFAFGAWHAALFMLLVLLPLYLLTDIIDVILDDFGSLYVIGGGALLWATTTFCTYRAVQSLFTGGGFAFNSVKVRRAGITWGGVNGAVWLTCLIAIGLLIVVIDADLSLFDGLIALLLSALATMLFAPTLGGSIGLITGLLIAGIDMALLRLTGHAADISTPKPMTAN